MPEFGFRCPLLAQIATELRETFPDIFGAHGRVRIWGFKYDSTLTGIRRHADQAAVRAYLDQAGARPVTVPYRENRAVIFDSDLFHETDEIDFKEGCTNRRINVTALYGRRTFDGS